MFLFARIEDERERQRERKRESERERERERESSTQRGTHLDDGGAKRAIFIELLKLDGGRRSGWETEIAFAEQPSNARLTLASSSVGIAV